MFWFNERNGSFSDIPKGYKEHLVGNINFRFKVSQPLQIRYGALISLMISVKWAIRDLGDKLIEPIKIKKPEKGEQSKNKVVQQLFELNHQLQCGSEKTIKTYELLVNIRNCIVHNSGIKNGYNFEDELSEIVGKVEGITLSDQHIFGTHIWIKRNVLNKYIESMSKLVIQLYEKTYKQKMIKI